MNGAGNEVSVYNPSNDTHRILKPIFNAAYEAAAAAAAEAAAAEAAAAEEEAAATEEEAAAAEEEEAAAAEAAAAATAAYRLGKDEELIGVYGVKDRAAYFSSFGFIVKVKAKN